MPSSPRKPVYRASMYIISLGGVIIANMSNNVGSVLTKQI